MPSTLDVLKDLIKINSINPFHMVKEDVNDSCTWKLYGNEQEISNYLEDLLHKNGFQVSRQLAHVDPTGKQHFNLLAEKGDGEKSILFYGHMDTASALSWKSLDEALMPREEKKSVNGEEKNVLIGLGGNDMKAGLAVMANAFKSIEPKGYKIKVVFGVDEEFYSLGSNALIKSDFLNDVVAIIVPEIGDGPNSTYGPQTIGLGRLGRCEYEIKVFGTGGHGSQSDNPIFVSAADECAKIALKIAKRKPSYLDEYFFSQTNTDGNKKSIRGSFFVNKLDAGSASLSIPATGIVVVDWTFTPNFTILQGKQYLEEMIDEMYAEEELKKVMISGTFMKARVDLKKRPTPASDAYGVSIDHLWVKFVKKIMEENLGFANYNFGYSVADENVFSRAYPEIPVLVIGPCGDNSHLADEWVEIESVFDLEKLYQDIVNNLLSCSLFKSE